MINHKSSKSAAIRVEKLDVEESEKQTSKDEIDHYSRSKELENQILEQKKSYRTPLSWILAIAVIGFYSAAFVLIIGIIFALYWGCIHDVPHGVLIFLATLCVTPTALLILSIKALFSEKVSFDEGFSALGEIAKEGFKIFIDKK